MRRRRGEYCRTGAYFSLFFPEAVLEVSKDNNAVLSAVGRHVIISLDCHDIHGGNCFGEAFGKTEEATIFLEGDLDLRVVLQ